MVQWTNKTQNSNNNMKGFTNKEKNQISSLQRKVGTAQKVADNKQKANNKQGNGRNR